MPYYVENESPLTQIAGLAAAYFNYKNMFDSQRLENERIKQEGAASAQDISASKTSQAATRQDHNLGPNDQPLPAPNYPAPPTPAKGKQPDPSVMYNFYMDRYAKAIQGNDPHAHDYLEAANSYSLMGDRSATADVKQAQVPYYQSRTRYNDAETKNVQGKFSHDLEMIQARGVSQQSVARIRAAYRKAGGGSGNSAAAESRAMYAAMNAAAREGTAAQNAVQDSIYRYQSELHISDPDNNPEPQQPQIQPMPIIIPGPGGQPITIKVDASGQIQRPQPQAVPKVGGQVKNKPPSTPKGQTPQGGGNPIMDWIHQQMNHVPGASGGGGMGSPIATDRSGRPVYKSNGKYVYSDGTPYKP